jgi:hypothetical protein
MYCPNIYCETRIKKSGECAYANILVHLNLESEALVEEMNWTKQIVCNTRKKYEKEQCLTEEEMNMEITKTKKCDRCDIGTMEWSEEESIFRCSSCNFITPYTNSDLPF